eukprot:gb/GECH01013171.1/.p1 GENE.gb/GECH01013171.1/~~gb/GECH01013171.1/.p1  ORF type:complete len:548 (+),score=115.84 gb/GECH01013171.1/:1-1644(+)
MADDEDPPTQEFSPLIHQQEVPRASVLRLLLITVCFAGVQFGWALQIGNLTPFMQELGMPQSLTTLVWLCGPVSGLVVQPVVGVLSDKTTLRWGRRRPYILVGAILIAISLLLIPSSEDIGYLFVKKTSKNPIAITLAVMGFWVLDLSNNTLQGPCRALIADMAAPDQQELGNAVFSLWLGLGNVTGYMAGFISWQKYLPIDTVACGDGCTNLRIAFSISIAFLIITTAITVFAAKEHPHKPDPASSDGNMFMSLVKAVFKMPTVMIRICTVQFFSWLGWFAFLIYITDWVGKDVYHGNPDLHSSQHKEYLHGVQFGNFGLAAYALVSMVFSPVVPRTVKWAGPRIIWAVGQVVLALCLSSTFFIKGRWLAFAVIGIFGIPWSITMTVPFALTGVVSPEKDRGLYMGVLNIFVVLPQLVLSGIGSLVSVIDEKRAVRITLLIGGVSSLIGALLCARLIIRKPSTEEKDEDSDEDGDGNEDEEDHYGDEYEHGGDRVQYDNPNNEEEKEKNEGSTGLVSPDAPHHDDQAVDHRYHDEEKSNAPYNKQH